MTSLSQIIGVRLSSMRLFKIIYVQKAFDAANVASHLILSSNVKK